jgi:hypothetical protein
MSQESARREMLEAGAGADDIIVDYDRDDEEDTELRVGRFDS